MRTGTLLVVFLLLSAHVVAQEPWRQIPLVAGGQIAPGWSQVGWGRMVVEEGVLKTECDERGLGLLVYTKERLGNCQIRVVYRCQDARDNAGVFIRLDDGILDWVGKKAIAVRREANGKLAPEMLARMREASEKEDGAWYAVHHGYEVQIMDSADAAHRTGSLYSLAPAAAAAPKAAGEWRTMTVTLDKSRVIVELDGQEVSRFDSAGTDIPPRKNWTEPKREHPRPAAGYIGLQTHDPGDVVFFKEVSVRPLVARGEEKD